MAEPSRIFEKSEAELSKGEGFGVALNWISRTSRSLLKLKWLNILPQKRKLEWFWKCWLFLFEKMCQFLDIHLEFQGGNWYTNRRPSSENLRGEDGYVIEEAEDPCVAQFSEDPVS